MSSDLSESHKNLVMVNLLIGIYQSITKHSISSNDFNDMYLYFDPHSELDMKVSSHLAATICQI